MTHTLIVDSDITAYKMSFVNERKDESEPGLFIVVSDGVHACRQLREHILEMEDKLKATHTIMVLSDKDNFRKKLVPSYKAHRVYQHRPLCLGYVRQYVRDNYDCRSLPGLEGDDLVGILATHPTLVEGEKTVLSIDKDFLTVPCTIYNPDKGKTTTVSESESKYNHLLQTLTGDRGDHYFGCPGIGPVKAKKILDDKTKGKTLWDRVMSAYTEAGLTEQDALAQARCARILQHTDYDLEKGEVILWNPEM